MGRANQKKPNALWRDMTVNDIDEIVRIADAIHPSLPESAHVLAERVKLFPKGCLSLVDCDRNKMYGYAISHPISYHQPPALDSFLEGIVSTADQYYVHDLAILPEAQGYGFAHEGIGKLLAVARRYSTTCLVSVYGTASFWAKYDFFPIDIDEAMTRKIRGYGVDAVYLERSNKGPEEYALICKGEGDGSG